MEIFNNDEILELGILYYYKKMYVCNLTNVNTWFSIIKKVQKSFFEDITNV